MVAPQFLIGESNMPAGKPEFAIAFRALSNATNERTLISALVGRVACGNSVGLLSLNADLHAHLLGSLYCGSLTFDWVLRRRIVGTNVNSFFLWESPWPRQKSPLQSIVRIMARLALTSRASSALFLEVAVPSETGAGCQLAMTTAEALRLRCMLDAVAACRFGLTLTDFRQVAADCDLPLGVLSASASSRALDAKGFWRVDKGSDAELRQTVLSLVAADDLASKIRTAGGDMESGIEAFLTQNQGEGWLIPETLRLADHGLGRDPRAYDGHPVATRLGPRLLEWQLVQGADESWRERLLHAENLRRSTARVRRFGISSAGAAGARQPIPSSTRVAEPPPQTSLFG
jgi:hypothetical protein